MREKPAKTNSARVYRFWKAIQLWEDGVKYLHGDPHFMAIGMAVGAFAAATPTIEIDRLKQVPSYHDDP